MTRTRSRFGDRVRALAEEGRSAQEIADELSTEPRTVVHFAKEHGIDLPSDPEGDEMDSGDDDESPSAVPLVPAEDTGPARWNPRPPAIPQPEDSDLVFDLLEQYRDRAEEMGWTSVWDMIDWFWDEQVRACELDRKIAGLQANLDAMPATVTERVKAEVALRVRALDEAFGARLQQLETSLERSQSEVLGLRKSLRASEEQFERTRRLNVGLYSENVRLTQENWENRAACDLLLSARLNEQGTVADAHHLGALANVLFDRALRLMAEQSDREFRGMRTGTTALPVTLGRPSRIMTVDIRALREAGSWVDPPPEGAGPKGSRSTLPASDEGG